MPEWKDPVGCNTAMGEGQSEYETIGIRRQHVPYDLHDGQGVRPVPMMVAKIQLSADELDMIRENGGHVFLNVMGTRWAPCSITATDEMLQYHIITKDA